MSKLAVMINSLAKASLTGKEVSIENSKFNRSILTTLLDSGWILSFSVDQTSGSGIGFADLSERAQVPHRSEKTNLAKPSDDVKSYKRLKVGLKQGYFDTSITSMTGINLKTKQLSKPSKRVYKSVKELRFLKSNSTGHHTIIITTSKGVMTIDEAISLNLGGELLFRISK
jgi:ribosomal protein S8